MARIVVVSGSLRRHSVNSAALTTIRSILDRRGGEFQTSEIRIADLPYYNEDLDVGSGPAAVRAARGLLIAADAAIISTPSYNGAMTGALKNALDWLSRPWKESPLSCKPVALLTASPGIYGGADAQPDMRRVLERCGAVLIDHARVAIGNAEFLVGRDGTITEPSVVAELEGLVEATVAAVRGHHRVPVAA
ncbi:NAD(P)H-dependent oxidoreductase [Streptomyces sp. H27-H1]|uniref:NADPH-dependent FMN reductase n=1 Tax=Streptomyces sp. H27-H1 TaxID=2996461 RepID=UPI00226D801D|nr:NADPH-dependent FMN reductase [Streptomyces sp. H27-H1]MCY0931251.1 NAD(P)H-dependent oxidoreductase [Streptomyces sp. H27-H1]